MNPVVEQVTHDIVTRSVVSRAEYVASCERMMREIPPRRSLSCGNLAHGYAACSRGDKQAIADQSGCNIGIITAYNDMLSAHQPLANYPAQIKEMAREYGATAQVASGVPAMCDGITQGQPGMELSLFSRDVVALSTVVGLSHNLFDAVICLGICDKIVPGMLIGALQFGHLPTAFLGSGPMATGLSNKEKAEVRQRFAEGRANETELLAAESASYHSAGTCTFYGTANSNQVIMEMLGLQLPGSSFLHPGDILRPKLANRLIQELVRSDAASLSQVVTERSLVNATVGLLATGGSTNHTLHLLAIARAAGIHITWGDMDRLSRVVPLLARVYPNGSADINDFQAAGGLAYVVGQLRSAGLLNEDIVTLLGRGLDSLSCAPEDAQDESLSWAVPVVTTTRMDVLRPAAEPFAGEGGLRRLQGNIGEGVIKVSAVEEAQLLIEAPAKVFDSQEALITAFEGGALQGDFIAVVRFQGPCSNGMPELHKLTPILGVLQDRGQRVALVTDGRMSGASGKVPAAIHVSPEAAMGGHIARVRDGDVLKLDARLGCLDVLIDEEELASRGLATCSAPDTTLGRGLFQTFRSNVAPAVSGAATFFNKQPN